MEQYIYIFTIILEIIVAVNFGCIIANADKKVVELNKKVLEVSDDIEEAIVTFRKYVSKFNKISSIVVKFKKFNSKYYVMLILDIISIVFLFKSFKSYKGIAKLNFIRKVFSYSVVRGLFNYLKSVI